MSRSSSGFTRTDLLVVVVSVFAVGVLAALFTSATAQNRVKGTRISCISDHKQCSLALKIYAADHGDRYPHQVEPALTLTTPHTSIELTNRTPGNIALNAAWARWGTLSNELGSPKVLLCPGNQAKRNSIALDFTTTPSRVFFSEDGLRQMRKVDHGMDRIDYERQVGYDLSTSFFINLNADEKKPAGILMGDANINWTQPELGDRINPARAGVQRMDQPEHFANFRFVRGRDHPRHYDHHQGAGNVALTDGSVSQVNNEQLRELIADMTNALGVTSLDLVIPQ